MVTNEEIRLVHSESFLQGFLSVERGEIVDDIPSMRTLSYSNTKYHFRSVGPIITEACRIAAGTTLHLISSVIAKEIDYGFALVRPAGHHSSTDQVGTFCGLNSISIGAVYAIEILKLERVLILDWDIHRSGGTQQILGEMSPSNQQKYRLIDIYAAFGKMSHLSNVPWNVYLIDMFDQNQIPGDEEYLKAFDLKILPNIIEFNPSLILISAGFDGAQGEAEECAQLTPAGYFQMTRKLKQLNIPLVFILEGGYQLQSLVPSIGATFQALIDL
jgi:acetoin utilization deacetylase AcuC-like enzyme